MTAPTPRELAAVSDSDLEPDHIQNLRNALTALGFDIADVTMVLHEYKDDVVAHFRDLNLPSHCFATLCKAICVRPRALQERLNFNETKRNTKKQGHSGSHVQVKWLGVPELCVTGSTALGPVFVSVYQVPGVNPSIGFGQADLKRIKEGGLPVRYAALKSLVEAATGKAKVDERKLSRLRRTLEQFPPGVKTLEDVLDDLTKPDVRADAADQAPILREALEDALERARRAEEQASSLARELEAAEEKFQRKPTRTEADADARRQLAARDRIKALEADVVALSTGKYASYNPLKVLARPAACQVLALNLRELNSLGVTLREIAEAFGLKRHPLRALEQGENPLTSSQIMSFCDYCEFEESDFAELSLRLFETAELVELFGLEVE